MPDSESEPLLRLHDDDGSRTSRKRETFRAAAFSVIAFLVIWVVTFHGFRTSWNSPEQSLRDLPKDPLERARGLLRFQPVIDGVR